MATTVAKVTTLIQGTSGLPGYQVLYFSVAGSVATGAEANDITGRVRAFWDGVKSIMAASVTMVTSPTVVSYGTNTGGVNGITTAVAPTGVISTGTGELPSATMLGLQLGTNVVTSRRLLIGRSFIGPLATAASTSAGVPTSTARSAVITAAGLLTTGATSSQLQVFHRPRAGGSGSSAPVVSLDCALKFWYLRSRRD